MERKREAAMAITRVQPLTLLLLLLVAASASGKFLRAFCMVIVLSALVGDCMNSWLNDKRLSA